ncbi:holo-ACP synthase [Streptomyces triticagri]|uniref:Holo-ACP synthase n=1 Tax=Streptomyces triticagri TaxID=2293568 RepID=A0A372LXG4_9ACTN|nr:4'-phosphopantetheinyl transferase superfamily protein [Streptomyces triticagri]RFU83336.1 holo-ACP synthase [Streptomyces triticagri]
MTGAAPLPRIGVDLVPLTRIPELLAPASGPALHRMLTPRERRMSDQAGAAGRLAAKEAVFKLFGAAGQPVPWLATEVLPGPGGRPAVRLTGRAAHLAEQARLGPIDLSISHDAGWAVAVAVAVAAEDPPAARATTPSVSTPTDRRAHS